MAFIAKQRYKLDIAPKGGWVIVYASQHDDGAREIEFAITNQGNTFSIPASINVSVQGIKVNGSYFSHSCSYSGNIVTMALADDMTDIVGKAICVLKFTNSSQQKLATAKFILNVDSDASSEGIIIDTDAEEIFNQMLNEIRAQAASVSADIAELQSMVGSPLVAPTVSAMTDHNKIYVYTGSESGYTNGNWYYWNGTAWTSGGVYNSVAIDIDQIPTNGSTNAVSSDGVYDALSDKVDKVSGKGLSTEDYTTAEKTKLADLEQVIIDPTFTHSGQAADAMAVGTVIDGIKNVIDLSDKIPINYSIVGIGYIQSNGGANANATTAKYTDYIDISGLEKIVYTRRGVSESTTAHYDAFYDANKEFISSRRNLYNQESDGYTEVEYTLPEGAAYARFTIWADTDTYGNFAIYCTDNVLVAKFSELEAENARTEQAARSNTDAINQIVSDFYIANTYSVDEWTTGGISTSGSNTSATNRKRNSVRLVFVDFSDEEDNLAIKVKDGYLAQLYEYYDTGGSLSTSNFKQILLVWAGGNNTVTISKGLAYRVALKKNDDSEFTESDDLTGAVIFKTQKSQDLYTNSTIVGRNDPVLMEEKLIQLNRATRIPNTKTLGTPPFCLLHFSDIHGDAKCLQNVIAFHKHYANFIDDMIHTGDNVTEYSTDGIGFWDDTAGAEKILNCIGNHDTRITGGGSTDWIALSMAESYDTYFAPYIEEWGVTYQSGKTYYYKDYTTKKIRLIVLDIMHQSAEQLAWFVETLASAKTAELHVICACHSRAHWQYTSYETSWDDKVHSPEYSGGYSYGDTSGNHGSSYPSNMSNDYADAVDDFIDDGGNFVCWIHGHTHYKMFATLTAHPNQLEVAVANASRQQYARTYVWARKDGTKSEDDFNIFAVDTYSKILRIAKVGVDYDRYMRHVDTISYDYGNHNLLYSG